MRARSERWAGVRFFADSLPLAVRSSGVNEPIERLPPFFPIARITALMVFLSIPN